MGARSIARNSNIDVLTTLYDPNHAGTDIGSEQEMFADSAVKAAATTSKLVTLMMPIDGSVSAEAIEHFLDKGVAVLGMSETFRALDRAVMWTRRDPPIANEFPIEKCEMAKRLREFGWGEPFAGKPALDFLAAAGIPVVESRFVDSVDAAVCAAGEIGYPVVVKIGDTDALHRTELSGVVTNLRDARELPAAAERLLAAGSELVIVQPYVRVELR